MKYTLAYVSVFVFIISISIYLYLLIMDYHENSEHTTEEIAWIYTYLVILVVFSVMSYYLLIKSNA